MRDRPKATQFPGRALAEKVTQKWHAKFATPLPYVGGGEFATNNIAVYSPDRPRVIVHADPTISPWVDRDALRRQRRRDRVGGRADRCRRTCAATHRLSGP